MNKINNKNDSIDLIELLSTIWNSKNFIIKTTVIFSVIGIIYSLTLNNSFTASSVFYPHFQTDELNNNQGLRGLAGLAGINLGSQIKDDIPPSLYPKIINSPQFKIEILDHKINLNQNKISFRDYLLSKNNQFDLKKIINYPISLFSKILKKNKSESTDDNIEILKISDEV